MNINNFRSLASVRASRRRNLDNQRASLPVPAPCNLVSRLTLRKIRQEADLSTSAGAITSVASEGPAAPESMESAFTTPPNCWSTSKNLAAQHSARVWESPDSQFGYCAQPFP